MFAVFRQFMEKKDAKALASQLNKHGIPTEIGDNASGIETSITGGAEQILFEVRIDSGDFDRANAVLRTESDFALADIDPDHYLFGFDNDELYEVLLKQDEWSEFDISAARKILQQRGKTVDDDLIRSLWNQRLDHLAQPNTDQHGWVVFGYIMALVGGLIGVVIGYVLWSSKKTLPDGRRVPYYSEGSRRNGKLIFIIGCITFPLFFALRLSL